jgi:(1->4)-alpha-D-glucan 1-alpha-D-glucosylmutase
MPLPLIATYRLQLGPHLGFDQVRAQIGYFRRLGVSHLYLSPITEARPDSAHGYDVVDHNRIREELGGADAFWRLLDDARDAGLGIILDFVPNHAYAGPQNARWQDVLAWGPHSPYAEHFDIDWDPLKPELQGKILLPRLGSTYGDALDRGEITLRYEHGTLAAHYGDGAFALAVPSYGDAIAAVLPQFDDPGIAGALATLAEEFRALAPHNRARADVLRSRLEALVAPERLNAALAGVGGQALHAVLERQYWRLSYWQTAAHEINYRRFFDVNELIGLRMERPEVFAEDHRLLGHIVAHPAIDGVRIDHIDGLFDPHGYLEQVRALGARGVWVEKILAAGETLPSAWSVDGTVGYEFLNDVVQVLTPPAGQIPLVRVYRRYTGDPDPYSAIVHDAKRLVMATALSGELFRLGYELDRLSEADYHTRDFTFGALREALAEIVAAFPRYRTYLPHDRDVAAAVIREAVETARLRNRGTEPTVYGFVARMLTEPPSEAFGPLRAEWIGRFQQYTAPVTAKGVEDTAFYRYLPLVALNEVGGDPDRFGMTLQAFHAHARYRALRYPHTLLTTATHDHKRGEDVRMRLIVLAETPEEWRRTVSLLARIARRHRGTHGPSRADEFLFYQTLVALWAGADRAALGERLAVYMQKASREAKVSTSWLDPNAAYEAELDAFVRRMVADPRVARAVEPLAGGVARFGFANSLTQLVLKLTLPGVPDFYQGNELLDGSLVDPDNRRPVDFGSRRALLDELEPLVERPDGPQLYRWIEAADERAKAYMMVRLLRFRAAHPGLFEGGLRPIEAEGTRADHLIAYAREDEGDALVVLAPRFPATLERLGGFDDTRAALPNGLRGRGWTEVLSGEARAFEDRVEAGEPWWRWTVWHSGRGGQRGD